MFGKNCNEKLGAAEHACIMPLCVCGVGRKVTNPRFTNDAASKNVILTWFLKGDGVLRQNGSEYPIHDSCVCMRKDEIPYTLELTDDSGPRLFLIINSELFNCLLMLIPELCEFQPVWKCAFSQEVFDAFFDFYSHMSRISQTEFYQLIPELCRYILLVTGIQNCRDMFPLEKGKRYLEENGTLPLGEIAEKCGMNYHTFRKQFTEQYGMPPGKYRIEKRIEASIRLMKQGLSVSETAELLGYPDVYTFSHRFSAVKGIPPVKYTSEE